MAEYTIKPWEGPGVGYAEASVHPVSKVLSILQDEMLPEDLVSFTNLLKDKITRATWEHVLPKESFDDEARGDVELKKSRLFHALEVQYSRNTALEMLRNISLVEQWHISLNARNIPIASLIENVLKDEKEYYERHGLGELDRIHFVGRQFYIKKIQKDLENDDVHGILICGMYGLGKTTLAKKICKSALKKMELRYVDLRNITTEEGAFHGIMSSLTGQNSFEYNKMHLKNALEKLDKKILLLLDNADSLMDFGSERNYRKYECNLFHELLKMICRQKNPKLKILLTSRFKLTNPENMASETTDRKVEERLDGALKEYTIKPLDQPDAMKLLDHELGMNKEKISYDEKAELAEACGFSPMAIQLAASQLKNNLSTTVAELTKQRSNTMTTVEYSQTVPSVTTEFAISAILQEGFMGSILEQVFTSLENSWQTKLMRLSVLEGSFDVRAAAACMRSDTLVEATLDLQYLLCRHLVEVTDISTSSGTVNLYKEGDVKYVIHTLTAKYLHNLQDEEKWRVPMHKAEKRFAVHFRDRLHEIHKMVTTKNVLTIYHEIAENKTHFKKMMILENDLGIVPKFERQSQLKKFTDMTWLYNFFSDPRDKRRYFSVQANLAFKKKEYGSYCSNVLWEIDILMDFNLMRETQQNLEQVAQVIKQHAADLQVNETQYKAVRASYFHRNGRYLFLIGHYDESVDALRKSSKFYEEVSGPSVTTAQAINMLGTAFFRKGHFEKAKECHSEAYHMLSSVTKSSLHFDTPVYLMNIGTVYQKLARKEKGNGFWQKAEAGLKQAVKYYDMSLDAYKKQNMYGSGTTIDILKMKANAKYDLEDYEEALNISDEVWAMVNRTMGNNHPLKGLHIAWVGTIYYDYAAQVLAKRSDSEECNRTYITAEQKLNEAGILVRANDNAPIEDPSYLDLKKFTRKVLRKLGMHKKLQIFEKKFKKYEEKRATMRIAAKLPPLKIEEEEETDSDSDTSVSDGDSQNEEQKPTKSENCHAADEDPEDDDFALTSSDLQIQHQVAYDSEVLPVRTGVKRRHSSTDSSQSDSDDDQSSSSDEEEIPRWQTCVIF